MEAPMTRQPVISHHYSSTRHLYNMGKVYSAAVENCRGESLVFGFWGVFYLLFYFSFALCLFNFFFQIAMMSPYISLIKMSPLHFLTSQVCFVPCGVTEQTLTHSNVKPVTNSLCPAAPHQPGEQRYRELYKNSGWKQLMGFLLLAFLRQKYCQTKPGMQKSLFTQT